MSLLRHFTIASVAFLATLITYIPVNAISGYYPRGVYPDYSKYKTASLKGKTTPEGAGKYHEMLHFNTPSQAYCTLEKNSGLDCGSESSTSPYSTINHKPTHGYTIAIDRFRAGLIREHAPRSDRSLIADFTIQPGTRITLGDTSCIAGNNYLLSCKNSKHGFVLQTTGDSWVI